MKRKTTFCFLCLVMVLLSIGGLDVPAAEKTGNPCTSYYTAYQSSVLAFQTASEARDRVRLAIAKNTPYQSIPPEWKHLEDEYDKDPSGFIKKWKEGVSVHPNIPKKLSVFLEILNSLGESSSAGELKKAAIAADNAYDAAKAAHDAAKKALEDCQGITVVTIWCERGVDCQTPPGVVSNPKLHYNSKCPNYIRVGTKLPLLAKACPGTWWSCEGVGQCPNRWSHLSSEKVAESRIVVPDTTSNLLAACGHAMPGHEKIEMPCGSHTDYSCKTSDHAVANCPKKDGMTCAYNDYYICRESHECYFPTSNPWASLSHRPCGHSTTATGDHSKIPSETQLFSSAVS